ncbi:hypothetical protein [Janthinobacterium lividum]|uniref:hypothetical protein n=1 Tax=Janthinobacterium lividum TaxID=29581 RepID=UPI001594EDDD|nr:hypothetical protein [Janthinobacterium lividum]MBH2071704.1 hypothetical protein [Burkholderiales bacterium]QKY09540.1 hypothetical protein G8765_18480 [Janthinobacterium lividum]
MKKVIVILLVAIVGIGGYFGYQHHAQAAFVDSLTPHIKNASIRVTNSSELEIKPSQATYKEVFDRLDADIAEIDKRLIDVQSLSSSKTQATSAPAIAYLRATQEFSRALSMKYRKTLAVNNSMDRFREAVADQISASRYGSEYEKRSANRAQEDADKALKEAKEAIADFVKATASLKTARNAAAAYFPDDSLVSIMQLDNVAAAYADTPEVSAKATK